LHSGILEVRALLVEVRAGNSREEVEALRYSEHEKRRERERRKGREGKRLDG